MKRPLLCGMGFYILGIIGGRWNINVLSMVIFYFTIILCSIWLFRKFNWKGVYIFPIFTFIGMIAFQSHWNVKEPPVDSLLQDGVQIEIEGTVKNLSDLIVQTKYIQVDKVKIPKEVDIQVYLAEEQILFYGDYVQIQGKLVYPQPARNPGGFDQERYMVTRGIDYILYGELNAINRSGKKSFRQISYDINNHMQQIFDEILPVAQASLLKAILLGDKDSIPLETKQLYQDTGIAHILAISGLHISILGVVILYVFTLFKVPQTIKIIGTIALLCSYCIFTGGSISTIRAVFMMSIVLSATVFKRTADIYTSIAASAFVLLLIQPLYLWDAGFQLSYGAVIGLVLITPIFDYLLFLPRWFRKIIGASCAAFISIAPIVAYHFYSIPFMSIILNPLVIPLVPLIICFGMAGGLLGFLWIEGARFVIGIVYYILIFFEKVSNLMFYIPFGSVNIGSPPVWKICLYYVMIMLVIVLAKHRKLFLKRGYKYIGPIFGIGIFLLIYNPSNHLEVVFLDVGQGDSIVIHAPNKQNYIIDGGGNIMKPREAPNTGIQTIIPYLSYKGITRLQAAFITHFDGDHVIGIIELLDHIKIDKLFIPDIESSMYNEYYYQLIEKAEQYNIPVYPVHQGDQWNSSIVNFYCIYPSDHIILNDVEEQNHSSVVLHMNYKNHLFLFTGDIEKEDENWIVAHYPLRTASILKVPHHGSNTSSTESFIDTIKPKVAVISSGRNNSYGHPHKEVVERYVKRNIYTYNTAGDGAIIVKAYTDKVKVIPFLRMRKDPEYEENKK